MSVYDLKVKKIKDEHVLCFKDKPILIAQGKIEVKSKSKSLIDFILKDFERCADIKIKKNRTIDFNNKFCAYVIFSDQKKLLEDPENKIYQENIPNLFIKYDRSLIRTANGPPYESMQLSQLLPIMEIVKEIIGEENFKKLSNYAWGAYYDSMTGSDDHGVGESISDEDFKKSGICQKIIDLYSNFSKEEKGSVHALYMCLDKMSFLMPILLVSKKISLREYSHCFMGLGINFTYIYEDAKNKKQENERYQELYDLCLNSASVVINYLDSASFEINADEEIIARDESIIHELKSTLRMNLKTNNIDEKMVYGVLKTIVGFLNTKGGNLVIGVSDNHEIIGLDKDKFKNIDEWQRFFKDKVNAKIQGSYLETFIHPRLIKIKNKDIAIIECQKLTNDKTAYLDDKVYIRQTASTKELTTKETVEWIKNRSI